ncbi:MAG: DUF3311 domain-containing protein [Phycisphaerae bacterium]|nr:DUF3311 domain-containing protein [Phycisphaerae bacterium]
MKNFVYALVILLIVLHQDFWFWDDSETLVLGFIPIGLAYHMGISIAAACTWALANHFCWPKDVDEIESLPKAQARGQEGH